MNASCALNELNIEFSKVRNNAPNNEDGANDSCLNFITVCTSCFIITAVAWHAYDE